MYLRNRPVFYTDGVQTIAVNYSAHARDLEQTGWTRVEQEKTEIAVIPEPEAQPIADAVILDVDLSSLTKSELISYASMIGVELKPNLTKAEIFSLIESNG